MRAARSMSIRWPASSRWSRPVAPPSPTSRNTRSASGASGAGGADEDGASRRRGRLECERICGEGHYYGAALCARPWVCFDVLAALFALLPLEAVVGVVVAVVAVTVGVTGSTEWVSHRGTP